MTSKNPHGLKVGQTLWVQREGRGGTGGEGRIEKIGNLWATVAMGGRWVDRIRLTTLEIDAGPTGGVPGYAWPSEQAYKEGVELDRRWTVIQQFVRHTYRRPRHLTAENMKVLEELLSREVDDDE